MTRNSYLKIEIRTRMERTGESYSAAARAVARGDEHEFPQLPLTTPPKVTPSGSSKSVSPDVILMRKTEHLKALIILLAQLDAMAYAQVPFMRAIRALAPNTEDPRLQAALFSVIEKVDQGMDTVQALKLHQEDFPGVLIPLIDCGGSLAPAASVYRTELEMLSR